MAALLNIISKLFGNKYDKDVKELAPIIKEIHQEYAKLSNLTNNELREKTTSLKNKITEFTLSEKKKIKQLKTEIHSAEKRLKRLQEKIAGVEGILQSPDTYDGDFQDDLHDLIRNQTELKAEIEEVEQIWLNLNEQLESSS